MPRRPKLPTYRELFPDDIVEKIEEISKKMADDSRFIPISEEEALEMMYPIRKRDEEEMEMKIALEGEMDSFCEVYDWWD